jgi:hypothetical protein
LEVESDLVRSPREGLGFHEAYPREAFHGPQSGARRLPGLTRSSEAHPPASRGNQRSFHHARGVESWRDKRKVTLSKETSFEGEVCRSVRGCVERKQQYSAGIAVEPVHHPHWLTQTLLELLAKARGAAFASAGHHE